MKKNKKMTPKDIKTLALQAIIFINALLENGADEVTADKLTNNYILSCLSIAALGPNN